MADKSFKKVEAVLRAMMQVHFATMQKAGSAVKEEPHTQRLVKLDQASLS